MDKCLLLLILLITGVFGRKADFLMIVGGYGGRELDTVELKSQSSDAPLPECLSSPRGNFPIKLQNAVGTFLGGRVIVCGGRDNNYNDLSTCWSYDPAEDRWTEDGRMQEEKTRSAATLNTGTGNEWFVSGGYGNGEYKSSVERTSDGRNFETFPQSMPITLSSHCLVSLDGDGGDLFVTGGWDGSGYNSRTFIHKAGAWMEMERMPTPRLGLTCGPVRSQPGGPVDKIVVSGGSGGSGGYIAGAKVEVFDVLEDSWETAADLPFGPLVYAEVIPFEDTFLIIGGYRGGGETPYTNKVWKYKKNGEWEEMPHLQLSEAKYQVTAIPVPSDIFPSC